MEIWTCAKCGWQGPTPKYPSSCPGCRQAYNIAYQKVYYAKKKANEPTNSRPPFRTCQVCGSTVKRGQKCSTCTRDKWTRWKAENDWKPKEQTEEERQRWREYKRVKHQELRHQLLRFLAGDPPCCACCGEAHLEFLAVDHINGDGQKHRQTFGSNYVKFYKWLLEHEDEARATVRVLCHNCNLAIGFYGYCPHQRP